ncbi:MAG: uracil-DNA glycosylase [Planctomycetes bacterium]|nr:uracil-DNA glycosylase [Planctomycetota bacterium]
MSLPHALPASWRAELGLEIEQPYFAALERFVDAERASKVVFPPPHDVFAAFALTPLERVRAVIVGQDPYHGDAQAHGLCFSVKSGVAIPPSLRNIFKELESDLGLARPAHGDLASWAAQGVLLLNTVLTVRKDEANSHAGRGWERFTDAALRAVSRREHVVFLLWGNSARAKAELLDARHTRIECAHPSPLSARKFLGSRPFSRANAALAAHGQGTIDWSLSDGLSA